MVLKLLDFASFMEKLRDKALEKDWDQKIKLSMLASKQGECLFYEWAYEMQTHNALLCGCACHFSKEALCEMLENNID